MAMNKTEKAEMDALREARDMARSLRWPEYPAPQPRTIDEIKDNLTIPTKTSWGGDRLASQGWDFNVHTGMIELSHSDGSSSFRGENNGNRVSWSQGPGRQFATKLEALQALRLELTIRYAQHLADLDARIAEEAQ